MWIIRTFLLSFSCAMIASCQSGSPTRQPAIASGLVHLSPGLDVDPERHMVLVRAWTCLDAGWLEQVVCIPGTREHESLMVSDVRPSDIHAALLLAGIHAGKPGRWSESDGVIELIPPEGDRVRVEVQWKDPESGASMQVPVSDWILDVQDRQPFPGSDWIFGGSLVLEHEASRKAGVTYLADRTGSIMGLVTFGDEVLGTPVVFPDSADVQPPEWIVNTKAVPPPGTEVTILLILAGPGQPASGTTDVSG